MHYRYAVNLKDQFVNVFFKDSRKGFESFHYYL